MDSVSAAIVSTASSMQTAQADQAISTAVLKTALNVQAAGAIALINALPQPALASSGSVGTLVNTYA